MCLAARRPWIAPARHREISRLTSSLGKLFEPFGAPCALRLSLARSEILCYQSRCGSKYVKPTNPSQCVDVVVNPFSNPASKTRFLFAV